jgi:hypothetical protein
VVVALFATRGAARRSTVERGRDGKELADLSNVLNRPSQA